MKFQGCDSISLKENIQAGHRNGSWIVDWKCDNPLTPTSIITISSKQVMRKKKNINKGIISRSNTKFSKLTSQELCGRQ